MYEDQNLICEDCGKEFVFSAGEQEFYAQKGLQNTPKRCQDCRKARKHKSKRKFYVVLKFGKICYCIRQILNNS